MAGDDFVDTLSYAGIEVALLAGARMRELE
jgi:hypothetical protein